MGKGAYGEVFEVVRKGTLSRFALKQIQKKLLAREKKEYQALVEKELLSNVEHPESSESWPHSRITTICTSAWSSAKAGSSRICCGWRRGS